MNLMTRFAFLAVLILTQGCATLHNGRHQEIRVVTDPAGATVEVRCAKPQPAAVTPVTIRLPRRVEQCSLLLSRAGFQSETVVFNSSPSGRVWGNFAAPVAGAASGTTRQSDQAFGDFLFGAILGGAGFGVDALTGAMWQLEPAHVERKLTPTLAFSNVQTEYGSLAEVQPAVVIQSGDPIYFMSLFPRYAAFLQRWDEGTQRWENGQRPITCATIKDADVPISVRQGARVPLTTYWQWTVERREEEVFQVGAYESRPIAGKYRLIVEYAREPWAFGKTPSRVLSAFSPAFRVRGDVPAGLP